MNTIKTHPLIELPSYGCIACHGSDSLSFLQGQLTADMREANTERALFSAYCDHKGRVVGSFYIVGTENQFWLLLPKNMIESLLAELNKFAVFSKVKCVDASENKIILGIIASQEQFALLQESFRDRTIFIAKLPGDQLRFLALLQYDEWQKIQASLKHKNFEIADESEWEQTEINSGIVMITPNIIGKFTPHDLNYPQIPAVSFKKGCYRGQEIVARMHYLGKLKQHLYRCEVSGQSCHIGDALVISAQQIVGHIVSLQKIADGHYVGLATIRGETDIIEKSAYYLQNYPEDSLVKITKFIEFNTGT